MKRQPPRRKTWLKFLKGTEMNPGGTPKDQSTAEEVLVSPFETPICCDDTPKETNRFDGPVLECGACGSTWWD